MIEFQSNSEEFGLNYKTDGLKCVWGGGGRGGGDTFFLGFTQYSETQYQR